MSEEKEPFDFIVIGSCPVGLTAAIYTCGVGLSALVLAGIQWGGQLMLNTDVENYPGFPDGVQGPELIERMWRQAELFGAVFVYEDATSVDFKSRPFRVCRGQVLRGQGRDRGDGRVTSMARALF